MAKTAKNQSDGAPPPPPPEDPVLLPPELLEPLLLLELDDELLELEEDELLEVANVAVTGVLTTSLPELLPSTTV